MREREKNRRCPSGGERARARARGGERRARMLPVRSGARESTERGEKEEGGSPRRSRRGSGERVEMLRRTGDGEEEEEEEEEEKEAEGGGGGATRKARSEAAPPMEAKVYDASPAGVTDATTEALSSARSLLRESVFSPSPPLPPPSPPLLGRAAPLVRDTPT